MIEFRPIRAQDYTEVSPLLKNLPSQCLYIVSKTNIISAKELAEKIKKAL